MIKKHISNIKNPFFCSHFHKTWIFSIEFWKIYINIRENLSSEIRVVPCWQTKLIVAFRNFAKAPKNETWTFAFKLFKNKIEIYCQSKSHQILIAAITLYRRHKRWSLRLIPTHLNLAWTLTPYLSKIYFSIIKHTHLTPPPSNLPPL
jgi:hypothetical protein